MRMSEAIVVTREQTLQGLRQRLVDRRLVADEEFRDTFRQALNLLELSDQDVADGLLVSRPTVNRWRSGKNLPHHALRKPILRWCEKLVVQKLRTIRQSAA